MLTAAPEAGTTMDAIPDLVKRDIIFSMGHTEADLAQAQTAVLRGASMVTHLLNAMAPFTSRAPGIFGLLGEPAPADHPLYFGVIGDGIHVHPSSVLLAYNARPAGFVLVTDAHRMTGMPDGVYAWKDGEDIRKQGAHLTLTSTGQIAGAGVTLLQCVNNLLEWTKAPLAEVLATVTRTPAKLLGLEGVKGSLEEGADADVVVLGDTDEGGRKGVSVDMVWKFGGLVYERE
jgi:N-acetylglucosamine-6-phosphate deacetylase